MAKNNFSASDTTASGRAAKAALAPVPAAVNQAAMAATLAPPAAAAPTAGATAPGPVVQPRDNYTSSIPTAVSAATGSTAAPAAGATAAPSTDPNDYQDQTYLDALAGLKQTMAGYQADHDSNLAKYGTQYTQGLTQLGYDPNTNQWNQNDTNTAYGRSFQNQLNDFGARDMLQSSFYGDALNNMLRQYNDQKTQLDQNKQNYTDDQNATLTQEQNENQQAIAQAKAEAIARLAAGVTAS